MKNVSRKQLGIIVIFISLGIISFTFGIQKIYEGTQFSINSEFKTNDSEIINVTSRHFYPQIENTLMPQKTVAETHFFTTDVFAVGNPIHFNMTVETSEPDAYILYYYLISIPSDELVTGSGRISTADILIQLDHTRRLFELEKVSPTKFMTDGTWIPQNTGDVKLVGMVVPTDGYRFFLPETTPIFEIESSVTKLQADTNRELKNQNNIIVGLTLVLIGLVPIGIISELLTRYYFLGKQ